MFTPHLTSTTFPTYIRSTIQYPMVMIAPVSQLQHQTYKTHSSIQKTMWVHCRLCIERSYDRKCMLDTSIE